MAALRILAVWLLVALIAEASVASDGSKPHAKKHKRHHTKREVSLSQEKVVSHKASHKGTHKVTHKVTAQGEVHESGTHQASAENDLDVSALTVQQLWRDHYQHIDLIAEYVRKFEALISEYRNTSMKRAEKLKAHFEGHLAMQSRAIHAVKQANKRIQADIDGMNEAVQRLRSEASDIMKTNKALIADITSVQGNFTVAQEFLTNTLNESEWNLNQAPEVEVLKTLEEEDISHHEEVTHRKLLKEIGNGGNGLSLLQVRPENIAEDASEGVGPEVAENEKDPKAILRFLTHAVEDLEFQQNNSEARLNHTFEDMLRQGHEKKERLLQQQEELNSTHASAHLLKSRLRTAVASLKSTREDLESRAEALRTFALRLGDTHLPTTHTVPAHRSRHQHGEGGHAQHAEGGHAQHAEGGHAQHAEGGHAQHASRDGHKASDSLRELPNNSSHKRSESQLQENATETNDAAPA